MARDARRMGWPDLKAGDFTVGYIDEVFGGAFVADEFDAGAVGFKFATPVVLNHDLFAFCGFKLRVWVADVGVGVDDFSRSLLEIDEFYAKHFGVIADGDAISVIAFIGGQGAQSARLKVFGKFMDDALFARAQVNAHEFLAFVGDNAPIKEDTAVGHARSAQTAADDFGFPGAKFAGDIFGGVGRGV